MNIVSAAEMRELDRRTIEEYGISGEVLMDRAGRGIADGIESILNLSPPTPPIVRLIAGSGNNGGDAFVAARYLRASGLIVEVITTCTRDQLSGDARTHFDGLTETDVDLHEMLSEDDWCLLAPGFRGIIVDALLGTGSSGAPRGTIAAAVRYINHAAATALVVAVDLPTGIDADTGVAEGEAVRADFTITMALPKKGLLEPEALDYVGQLQVVDIGVPPEILPTGAGVELISSADAASFLNPRRPRDGHKGDFGRVLIVGGALGYSGAVAMAATAALRTGAGLVTAVVPGSIAAIVAGHAPEIMVKAAPETAGGSLSHRLWDSLERQLDEFDAVLLGPGLSRCEDSLRLVRDIVRDCPVPLVVDADGVAVMEGAAHWFEKCNAPVVITPHPGEMATLLMREVREIQSDRRGTVRAACRETRATVVLKGAGTCVGCPEDEGIWINMTGNPGMATAGSGDVLAGMIAALIAQKLAPLRAVLAAVYLHGRAGSRTALLTSETGLIASDLIDEIPFAIRELVPR